MFFILENVIRLYYYNITRHALQNYKRHLAYIYKRTWLIVKEQCKYFVEILNLKLIFITEPYLATCYK